MEQIGHIKRIEPRERIGRVERVEHAASPPASAPFVRSAHSGFLSGAARAACVRFGLEPGRRESGSPPARRLGELAESLDRTLGPGHTALLTGPSGSGKSRLLRALGRRLRDQERIAVEHTLRVARGARVVDVAGACLGAAGLADARLLIARADRLSVGERWRLSLARAMEEIEQREQMEARGSGAHAASARSSPFAPSARCSPFPSTLLIDEFASVLDRPLAMVLARLVRRWAGRRGVRVVCATAHDDLMEALAPECVVAFDGEGAADVVSGRG